MGGSEAAVGSVLWLVAAGLIVVGLIGILRRRRSGTALPPSFGIAAIPVPTDAWQRLVAALAAPYARVEATRRRSLSASDERLYFGYAIPGDDAALARVRHRLRREWAITDRASAQAQVGTMNVRMASYLGALVDSGDHTPAEAVAAALHDLGFTEPFVEDVLARAGPHLASDAFVRAWSRPTRNHVAFDVARVAHLLRGCTATGFLTHDESQRAGDILGAVALLAFEDWHDYGTKYRAGLRAAKAPSRRQLSRATGWLLSHPHSPWQRQPWRPGWR